MNCLLDDRIKPFKWVNKQSGNVVDYPNLKGVHNMFLLSWMNHEVVDYPNLKGIHNV